MHQVVIVFLPFAKLSSSSDYYHTIPSTQENRVVIWPEHINLRIALKQINFIVKDSLSSIGLVLNHKMWSII